MIKTFGEFLKERRLENKLTQKELAGILFVSESAVSKWEKDVAHPDITLLPKLSEILKVSEHELITASIDNKSREEKLQAQKWRNFKLSWNLFFQISYIITLITCFICNLAISNSLSWFWIVASALLLSFSFTHLPKLVKQHKLLILPASIFGCLTLLLAVCAIYSGGDWFIIPVTSILFVLIVIFTPIYISKYKIFKKIRKFNDFTSVGIDFIFLNLLLITIDLYTVINNYLSHHWYISVALPIACVIYCLSNIFMSIRFLRVNKLLKTSIVFFIVNTIYCLIPLILKSNNSHIQKEFDSLNFFKASLNNWNTKIQLERNIHLIIFLTILTLATIFLVCGLIKQLTIKTPKKNNK